MASSAGALNAPAAADPSLLPTPVLLSTGCNRASTAMVWLPHTHATLYPEGLIAFAAGNTVAVYDPRLCAVTAILRGHSGRVNAVHWLHDGSVDAAPSSQLRLVSAGADKTLMVWQYDAATRAYSVEARLTGHEEGISAVAAAVVPPHTSAHADAAQAQSLSVVATTSTDLTTRIWVRDGLVAPASDEGAAAEADDNGGWRCIQALPSGRHKIMHSLAMTYVSLPDHPLRGLLALGVGGVDGKVHLWVSGAPSGIHGVDFAQASSLQGHENWITSLDFAVLDREEQAENGAVPAVSLMLASASQDRHIRLWKLQVTLPAGDPATAAAAAPSFPPAAVTPAVASSTSLGSRGHIVSFSGLSMLVVLESVLSGHDNWVMAARWQPALMRTAPDGSRQRHQPMCLLSASTDKCMMVWRPTLQRVWNNDARVGDMGGHTLGFYGCAFSPLGDAIIANGYSGSLHLWRTVREDEAASGSSGMFAVWQPAVTVSGHAGNVTDMCWDAHGDYLLTTSSDQTTRLFAPWADHSIPAAQRSSDDSAAPALHPTWHEISRPQLHGYDLNCLCPIYDPAHTRAHSIASGADEKVVRVFWAPMPFLDTLRTIAHVDTIEASDDVAAARPAEAASIPDENRGDGAEDDEEAAPRAKPASAAKAAAAAPKGDAAQLAFLEQSQSRALKANLPELGLSNKALRDGESANTLRGMSHVQEAVTSAGQRSARVPPPEDYLLTNTLWPEVEKLYGHGYELISLACNYDGTMLASACVAKKNQHAVVRVWETKDWAEMLQLESHRSSVVQMQFSPDNRYLLSVSRDRHVSLFEFRPSSTSESGASAGKGAYAHVGSTKLKAHARIIWSCSWAPVRGAYYFATGSRDKTVKCFRVDAQGAAVEDACLPVFGAAVTAVAFAPMAPQRGDQLFPEAAEMIGAAPRLTLAVGLEDGSIELWQSTAPLGNDKLQWARLHSFHSNVCLGGRVKRICWRWRGASDAAAVSAAAASGELDLAVCGEDQSVRIFAVPAGFLGMAAALASTRS